MITSELFFSSCPFKQTVSSWHFFRERAIFPDYTNLVLHLIRFIIMGFFLAWEMGKKKNRRGRLQMIAS